MTATASSVSAEHAALRAQYRSFMEEHVYPNEEALSREDDAAVALLEQLRAQAKQAGLVGPSPSTRGGRDRSGVPRLRQPERGDRPGDVGTARVQLPGPGRRER